MRRLSRLTCLAASAVATACGDRAPEQDLEVPPAARPVRETPAPVAEEVAVAPRPQALLNACLAGLPGEGTPWRLVAIDTAWHTVAVDSIERLAPRDSAQLAARVSRTVDVLQADTAIADFRGLPVTVRAAWRIVPAEGDTVVAALVARRLPIESNPLEELYFLLAAPGVRAGVRAPLLEQWVVRDVGVEEALSARELLGVFGPADSLRLALAHEVEAGTRLELLERRGGRWQLRWAGAIDACP